MKQYRICWRSHAGETGHGDWLEDDGYSTEWVTHSNSSPLIANTWIEWREP